MPHRVRRYRDSFNDMLHELKLMRGRGEIKVPENMSSDEFEEIMKKIDHHFSDGGVRIHHPTIRGRITDTSSIEALNKFFQHIYAVSTSNHRNVDRNMANSVAIARNAQNRRAQAAVNRMMAAATARRERARVSVPRNAAATARARTATRNARRSVGRNAAAAAAAAAAARSAAAAARRSRSRSRPRSSGTMV